MKDVETTIFSRLTGDATLVSLIGGTDKIVHGFQNAPPRKPQLTFWQVTGNKGILQADQTQAFSLFFQFSIFANNYLDVCRRLKRLFDNQIFEPQGGFEEADCIYSHWDLDVQDNFDENLKIKRKDCRVRFTVKLKPQDPI